MIRNKREDYYKVSHSFISINLEKNLNEGDDIIYRQIIKDLPRTFPQYKIFSYQKIKDMMLRILFTWSKRFPATGYVQGLNDLLTPFVIVFISEQFPEYPIEEFVNLSEKQFNSISEEKFFEIEADTYGCFTLMMNKIQNNYINNQPGIQKMIYNLKEIVKFVDNDIIIQLNKYEIDFEMFCFRWMNNYLMRELTIKNIIRLWDTYFSEEDAFNNFHLFVCASLLLNFSDTIKELSSNDLSYFLMNLPTKSWNLSNIKTLLAKAFQIKTLFGRIIS